MRRKRSRAGKAVNVTDAGGERRGKPRTDRPRGTERLTDGDQPQNICTEERGLKKCRGSALPLSEIGPLWVSDFGDMQ